MLKTNNKIGVGGFVAGFFLIVLLLCGVFKQQTKAAYYESVGEIKQTDMSNNSITMKWDPVNGAVNYRIENTRAYTNEYRLVGTTTKCQIKVQGLQIGSMYHIKITPISASGEEGFSNTLIGAKTSPDSVHNFKIKKYWSNLSTIDVSWKEAKAPKPDIYEITLYNKNNKKVKTLTIYGGFDTYDLRNLKKQAYTIKIRAGIRLNNKVYYSKYSSLKTIPQPSIKKCKIASNKLQVSWSKVQDGTGYDIYVSNSKTKGYKKVKSVGKNITSVKISKFNRKNYNSKKTYYVYVTAKWKSGSKTIKSKPVIYWNSKNNAKGYFK